MTFDSVKGLGEWKPIRNCPGRFVLHGVPPTYGINDLLGENVIIQQFQSPRARDVVFVVCLDNGGIISYHRSSGTWLHTLNTEEGFRRKVEQLEIIPCRPVS
jgi:hypothetical protein